MNFGLISSSFLSSSSDKNVEECVDESPTTVEQSLEKGEEAVEIVADDDESRNDAPSDSTGTVVVAASMSKTEEADDLATKETSNSSSLFPKKSFSLASSLFHGRGKKSKESDDSDHASTSGSIPAQDSTTGNDDKLEAQAEKEKESGNGLDEKASTLDQAVPLSPTRRSFPFRAPTFLGRVKKTTTTTSEAVEIPSEDKVSDAAEEETPSGVVESQSKDVVVATESCTSKDESSTTGKKATFSLLSTSLFGRSFAAALLTSEQTQSQRLVDGDNDASLSTETKTYTEEQVVAAEEKTQESHQRKSSLYFDDMAANFMKLIKGESKTSEGVETVSNIVTKVRTQIEQDDGDNTEDTSSLMEIIKLFGEYKGKLGEVAKKYVGTINLGKLSPTAVMYYVEREDELKNPSWKRRQHRFCPAVKMEKVCELNDALDLALLCYADTADDIKEGLDKHKTPYDLVYVSVKSSPGQPANFVAVKRDQSSSHPMRKISTNLYVVIGVRGTKTAADAVTDLLCDTADYKGGKAHSYILESGRYIAEKHRGLLEELRVQTGKAKIKVKLIGHSLGAGAASIAAMELYGTSPTLDVQAIGFGCPALVSNDLAEKASYITTVVNDTDVVPRMSGIAVANLLLDMMAFNWMPYAQRDIHHSLEEMKKRHSRIFKETTALKIVQTVEPLLEKHWNRTFLKERPARLEPEVYPPGKCIHFYRDGSGLSGAYVPNTFFSEIDVTRRMIDDHVFHVGYQQTLLEIVRQQEKDHHFRFEG